MKPKHYLKHYVKHEQSDTVAQAITDRMERRFFIRRGGGTREVQARLNNNHNQNKLSVKTGRRQKAGREHNTQIRNPN